MTTLVLIADDQRSVASATERLIRTRIKKDPVLGRKQTIYHVCFSTSEAMNTVDSFLASSIGNRDRRIVLVTDGDFGEPRTGIDLIRVVRMRCESSVRCHAVLYTATDRLADEANREVNPISVFMKPNLPEEFFQGVFAFLRSR
ncbi:MAG TPA: hypothetical protein VFQ60_02570 [Patescibacteria group bacterium]|nr:hypothetical protein [Patescibacteria group bacterium]